MKDVVIFSPSRLSLYTICVTELLRRNGFNIKAIVVRKLFNPNRFLFEIKRDGFRLIQKIWKKIFLRKRAYTYSNYETIKDLMKIENIHFSKVDDFQKNFKIPVLYCKNLNDARVIDTLKQSEPDIVVFTGGGLLRNNVLKNSGDGVLNCHSGVLPHYRGMDVIEWAIFEEHFDRIGITVHFMDNGIDTGDIIQIEKINIEQCENITHLRNKFEPMMCRLMVNACIDYFEGKRKRIKQNLCDGKQFFMMHPRLKKIAENKMKKVVLL
jgi:methionyl-tRNA formyltransferase